MIESKKLQNQINQNMYAQALEGVWHGQEYQTLQTYYCYCTSKWKGDDCYFWNPTILFIELL